MSPMLSDFAVLFATDRAEDASKKIYCNKTNPEYPISVGK